MDEFAVTRLEVPEGPGEARIGVRYRVGGDAVEDFSGEIGALAHCEREHRTQPGWNQPAAGASRLGDFPLGGAAHTWMRWRSFPGLPLRWLRPRPSGKRL